MQFIASYTYRAFSYIQYVNKQMHFNTATYNIKHNSL